jgi:aspartate/methionine/tyrosine aminotransferase
MSARQMAILRGLDTLGTVFSRRASRDQSPNAIAALLPDQPRPAFDLTGSNPTNVGLKYPDLLLRALLDAQAQSLVYRPEPFGSLEARQAVARLTCAAVPDILLTASTSEAYAFLFKLLCDPGDQVLIPAPSYPLFEHLAELEGVQATPYRLAYDGAWHVDLDSVRRAVSARTRAIVVVSPNNPTGHYLAQTELTALATFGLPLICDQVFAEFALGQSSRPRAEAPVDCLSFWLDGLSKRAGSPQLKLAWTVIKGPEALRHEARARLELIADTFLSVAAPVQRALPAILDTCSSVTALIAARCRENLSTLSAATRDTPVTLLRPEAGWSAVLHLPRVLPEERLVLDLLREQQVLVQPGWFYDFENEPHAIVSLLTEPRVFSEGVARLVEHVKRL